MTAREIYDAIKEAEDMGCLSIRLTGGEPLIRDDFEEIYLYIRHLGLKVILFTNATLINSRLVDLLRRVPPLEKVEVTIYGMTKASYEALTRTPGSFQAAFDGVDLLLKAGIPFVVKGAVLPQNIDDINDFEAWASHIPWMTSPPNYSMFFNLRGRRDNRGEEVRNNIIRRLRLSPQKGLEILTRRSDDYLRDMKQFCSKFLEPPGDRLFSCGAGLGSCSLDAYGNLQPCLQLRHPDTTYDLSKGSLKDALTNFLPRVRQMRASNSGYLSRCAHCFLKSLCDQCPARSWLEHGTLDTPVEYLCEIAHAQALYLGLVEPGEKAWEVLDWEDRIKKLSQSKGNSRYGHRGDEDKDDI
jgi:radical SAM protein with 4Fe4S-binding SPASM domain